MPHAPPAFLSLLRQVHRISRRDEVRGHAQRVRAMSAELSDRGSDALQVAELAARIGAALVRRLSSLFEAEHPAPAPWAWLALGSEARREQPLPTDQDHALAFAPASGAAEWARALADRLEEDLEAAGLPPCAGGLVASRWHAELGTWCRRLQGWIEEPEPRAVLSAAALADARRIAGRLDVRPIDRALARAADQPRFLRELARAALQFRPPAPVLMRLGLAELDREALAPAVLLGRVYALAARSPARGTCARLRAARDAGLLGGDAADPAAAAFRSLVELRFRADLRAGKAAGPLELRPLPSPERDEALRAVRAILQLRERAAHRFLR